MVFLPAPFQSSSWISWNNVATSFGCLCVQERTKAGEAKNESIGYRLLSAEEDLKPFRIIYTTVAADFAASENERQRVMAQVGSGEPGNVRSVVAVASSLATILSDWGTLLKAWPAVYIVKDSAASRAASSGRPAPTTTTLSAQDWQPVYMHMKNMSARDDAALALPAAADAVGDASSTKNPTPAVHNASRHTPPQPTAKRQQPQPSSKESRSAPPKQRSAPVGSMSSMYYDVFDTAVLQLCDLFTWQSPQLSVLVLATVAVGGAVLARFSHHGGGDGHSGETAAAPLLLPWPATLCVLLGVALPLTHTQTHRRRIAPAGEGPSAPTTEEASARAAEADAMARRVAVDAERLKRLAWLVRMAKSAALSKKSNRAQEASAGASWANPLVAGLALLPIAQLLFAFIAPCLAPSAVLHLITAPAVILAMLTCGALQLQAAFDGHALSGSAVASGRPSSNHKRVKFSVAKPSQAPSRAAPVDPPVAARKKLPETEPSAAATGVGEPSTAAAAGAAVTAATAANDRDAAAPAPAAAPGTVPPSNTSNSAATAAYKFRLPALTDKESAVLQQLTNYGAPFSMVVLKPLREWNQTHGWETMWERDGLRCEERVGRGDALTIRLTANIPNSNVGALEAITLDDPDFLDAKSTCAYQYSPLLSQRCVVKRLAYNMVILLTRHRSPVHGVPPLELLHYVSPAVLLDPEQQAALELRRPFTHVAGGAGASTFSNSGTHTTEVVLPLDEKGQPRKLMAFAQCGIPCPMDLHPTPPCQPPHVRGATEASLILGMEEADGSLTLGVFTSLNSKGIIPKSWESVYRSIAARKAGKIAELLGQEGPKPTRLAVYKNQRDFQPFLDRQALSEPEPLPHKARSRAAMARRAQNLSREAQFYISGNALFTADMEATMPTHAKTHSATLSDSIPVSGATGDAVALPSSLAHYGAALVEPKFPKLPQRFVEELLTLPGWTPDGSRSVGGAAGKVDVTGWSCLTPLSPRKATASLVHVPGTSLAMVEAVLLAERVAPQYNPLIERRVTVTPTNLPSLLMAAAGDGPLPTPDFPRDSYHGCSIHYTQFRSPMWGVAPRDTVTRIAEPFYFTAGDARQHLFTQAQLAAMPVDMQQLPDSARMLLSCGEDASEVLPPMKQYQRGRVFLFGYLCWEEGRAAAAHGGEGGESGVAILAVSVTEASGKLVSKLADKSIQDPEHVAVRMKELLQKLSAGDNKIRLL